LLRICYLCGEEISEGELSYDHTLPKQFIKRKQPKAKGFDYTGVLPTHKKCNNRFGAERMCQKSLQLIDALYNPECFSKHQHRDNPKIEIMAFNQDCLPGFTNSDLRFFKFIDGRKSSIEELSDTEFYRGKQKTDPLKQPLNTALSVLAKSAAAILVSRFNIRPDALWRVLCIPYHGASLELDFDTLLGDRQPFEIGVKLWVAPLENSDFFAVYKCQALLLYMLFWFSGETAIVDETKRVFSEAHHLYFEGSKLIALSEYDWAKTSASR
jgi:hypothetical protein